MTPARLQPGLFGIKNSNLDLAEKSSWGKNKFNNTFPAALANYMASRSLDPVYICLGKDFSIERKTISVQELYNIDPNDENIDFAFEEKFTPYSRYVAEELPRVDLVIGRRGKDGIKDLTPITPIEIKLTALPDDQTSEFGEEDYGSEIVVRPDTIVYLALSLIHQAELSGKPEIFAELFGDLFANKIDWRNETEAEEMIPELVKRLDRLFAEHRELEVPILMQPIWKTKGKTGVLEEHCLDIFIWSSFSFVRLFANQVKEDRSITRPERSVIWTALMLDDYIRNKKLSHQTIIDTYTYGTRNDKAFALGGLKTREYMRSPELLKPRVTGKEIQNIILGDGQDLLSPERRFDGVIQNAIEIF